MPSGKEVVNKWPFPLLVPQLTINVIVYTHFFSFFLVTPSSNTIIVWFHYNFRTTESKMTFIFLGKPEDQGLAQVKAACG